jgi:hypothetical protein
LIRYSVGSSESEWLACRIRGAARPSTHRSWHGALKISSKDFKIDDLIQPLEIVALRGNVFQTLVDIEKLKLS